MLRTVGVASAFIMGASLAPAAADEVSADEALKAIGAACKQSRESLVVGGDAELSDGSRAVVSESRLQAVWSGRTRLIDAVTGTYGPLSEAGLTRNQQRAALRYLKRPSATHWLRRGVIESPASGLVTTFERAREDVAGLAEDCTRMIAGAAVATRAGRTWQFVDPGSGESTTIVLDDAGRLVTWTGPAGQRSWAYGPRTVDLPDRVVGYAAWRKAAAAASLNVILRTIARSAAATANAATPTVDAIGAAVRVLTVQPRAVRVKVRQLRKGTLVYARNRYTKTYHAWRVYLKGERAVARRVAP